MVGTEGGEPGLGQVARRNAVKALPWQMGHMGAVRLAGGEPEALGLLLSLAEMAVFALVAGPPLLGVSGLHDRVVGTAVERSKAGKDAGTGDA